MDATLGAGAGVSGRQYKPQRLWAQVWNRTLGVLMAVFLVNVFLMIATVAINSVATAWRGTWLPESWTFRWYAEAWREFQLGDLLLVTFEVMAAVVALSVLLGVPAAYALARREFPGKRALMFLFLLPLLIPPITYGIPLATVMYKWHLAGNMLGVILANLIPALPFVILVMTPFIEQIDPNLESAARVFGARTRQIFTHVLAPLLAPGILAAALLVLVRTVAMFELTFLTAGPDSQTLVVALYYAMFAPGVRTSQSVDAMAMVYMAVTLVWLLIALRFVNPTQLVSRVKEHPRAA
jgi:putative spermidine/putrescine transport system permease protein